MLKAGQAQVIQQANINMVQLRNAEIQYFSQFFSNFGTQAALIASICVNSVSQVPGIEATCNPFWKYLYWLTTAICLAYAMHVLLCTVFISVYGQGLALRGPLGSMARAVEGMVVEQEQVVQNFCLCIFFLALSLMGTYGIMMNLTGAIITSIMTFFGMIMWYHYTLRIYNRFKLSVKNEWAERSSDAMDEQFPDPDAYTRDIAAKIAADNASTNQQKKQQFNVLSTLFGSFNRNGSAGNRPNNNSNNSNDNRRREVVIESVSNNGGNATRNPMDESSAHNNSSNSNNNNNDDNDGDLFSGYMTVHTGSRFSKPWVRRFFVLKGCSAVYYKSREDFEKHPNDSINKRAVSFSGYTVDSEVTDSAYGLVLTPLDEEDDRKVWQFRCDTMAELEAWKAAFERGIVIAAADQRPAVGVPAFGTGPAVTSASVVSDSRSVVSSVSRR